jgi:peptidoglycan/LPS O-acetylase OafA/YrhL
VLVFHFTCELFGSYTPRIRASYLSIVNDGRLAVYVFFLLSGFVLTQSYLRTWDRGRIQGAALGRYVRLAIPIALASLCALLMMKAHLFYNQQAAVLIGRPDWLGSFYTQRPTLLSWAKFSSYSVFFDYNELQSYDVFLWIMPIELLGSFLLLGLVSIAGPSRRARLFFYCSGLLLCWKLQPMLSPFFFGVLLAEFVATDAYARLSRARLGAVLGAALLAVGCVGSTFDRMAARPRVFTLLAVCLLLAVLLSPLLQRFLEWGPSRWLGRISFPLYLFHSLVLCGPSSWLIVELTSRGWSRVAVVEAVVPASVLLSVALAQLSLPLESFAVEAARRFAWAVLGQTDTSAAAVSVMKQEQSTAA